MGPSINYGFSASMKVDELEKRVARLEAMLPPAPIPDKPEPFPASPSQFSLEEEIREAINRHSAENGSDTPDFILAQYLIGCLTNFNNAVRRRTEWYQPAVQKSQPPFSR